MNEPNSALWEPSPLERRLSLAALIVSALTFVVFYLLTALFFIGKSWLFSVLASPASDTQTPIGLVVSVIVLGITAAPAAVVALLGATLSRNNTRFMYKKDARIHAWAFALATANLVTYVLMAVAGVSANDFASWFDLKNFWTISGAGSAIATVWLCLPAANRKAGK